MSSNLGTNFRKLDLHIHTPKSTCYSDKSAGYEQIVRAAVSSQLDAIAITDHNTVDAVEEIRQIGLAEQLVIFPGLELTTGSGHFLAIFDINTPVSVMNQLLDDMGVIPALRGDGAEQIPMETLNILKNVHESGGVVIAAHIERWPSGFLESKETRSGKANIHSSPYLDALEITVAQNQAQWENGAMRGYTKKYACVQGSDAHSPAEVGRRPTYLRLSTVNLAALKEVFRNWLDNIKFTKGE